MRKKRKKRRRSFLKKNPTTECIVYKFTNLEIHSRNPLTEEQLVKLSTRVEDVINSSIGEHKSKVAKKILVQMYLCICSVQYNLEIQSFIVTVNEKYFVEN